MSKYSLVRYEEEKCHTPGHVHEDEIIKMARFNILGVFFDVTQDGNNFKVRSDGHEPEENINEQGVFDFIISILTGGRR